MGNTAFDPRDFRSALGQFPTGVTVITTLDEQGEPIGCTASSFNSVSIDPALVLWSVDKGAFSARIFEKAEYFAVNVLSEDQVAVSNRFAGRGEDKFKDVNYSGGLGKVPLLEGCGAQFQCKTWNVYEGGDHLIIVGEVIEYSHAESKTPLVFSRGSYAITSPHPNGSAKDKQSSGNDFLDDYLLYLLNATISRYRNQLYPMLIETKDVSPEQWRIITILSDTPPLSLDGLSKLVMQPLADLKRSIELLKEREVVQYQDGQVTLTDEGAELQQALFEIAKQHEASILRNLNKSQVKALKSGLKNIIGIA